jgi:hypothetical protein
MRWQALGLVPGVDPESGRLEKLRELFVSLHCASGVTIEVVAGLVGHQGTRVTEQVYLHKLRPVIRDRGHGHGCAFERPSVPCYLVGDTGFEPVTSSVSRKRATTAPIARDDPCSHEREQSRRGGDGI